MQTNLWRGPGRAFFLCILMAAAPLWAAAPEYRVLWVDLFHAGLRSQKEADTMLETAHKAGYNTIVIEVRKACDAYYDSQMEPKNPAVQAGFDPLHYITTRAHQFSPRMDVHAWLVTYRARIRGDSLWKSPDHVFQKHPEWLSQKQDGGKSAPNDTWFLDPGVPQVIDYNLLVVRDILSRYDVDGIVFDYIRYPDSEGMGNLWGYNPIALKRFHKLYGRSGTPKHNDPEFSEFRRRQISDHMRKIYAHVRAWRPHVKVGAATITWGSIGTNFGQTSAYAQIMQDWPTMATDGWLDVIMPMNYKRESNARQAKDHRDWAAFLANVARQSGRAGINIVDGENLNSLNDVIAQIRATRNLPGLAGISTYAYAEPRLGSPRTPDTEFFDAIKKEFFSEPAAVPDSPWLSRPTTGLIKGVVARGGEPVDGATVTLGNRTTHTDGTGFYAFNHVPPGNHRVSASMDMTDLGQVTVAVKAGGVAEAPIASKKD